MKLLDFCKQQQKYLQNPTPTNIDDIFRLLVKEGIKEIEITPEDMILVVEFIVANIPDTPSNKRFIKSANIPEFPAEADTNYALNLLREGKIDKFFGIKLTING